MKSFYVQVECDQFDSTEFTAGPWGPDTQHAGPPSALLTRAFEMYEPRESTRLARVAVDILSPVPVDRLSVQTASVISRRNVELLEGTVCAGGTTVLRGRAWRFSKAPTGIPAVGAQRTISPVPDQGTAKLPGAHMDGYMSVVDWRFASGGFMQREPSSAWLRPRIPLLTQEELTPWQRTMIVADSGSGVHMPLNPMETPTVNCDLVVTLDRDPVGDWIGLEAATTIVPDAGGTTNVRINDEDGVVGSSSQVLFIRSRTET
ncbi:MAG: thioesterase family protein [Corynebacterium sp.]|uniref:thioesterase family protein n=1 Tax=unclassified Corynebacterium TaxID=2624378 RepID=UPI0009F8B227